MAAFAAAVDAGADRLEMDIGRTADGAIILIHDSTVDRTTDGTGEVSDLSYREIRSLDAGSWKSKHFAGERVPLLDEVFERFRGTVTFNLEIKTHGMPAEHCAETIAATLGLVKTRGLEEDVVISSFSVDALRDVRKHSSQVRVLLIDWSRPEEPDGLEVAIAARLDAWSPHRDRATFERIQRARNAGVVSHVGGIGPKQISELAKAGLNGISANDPAWAIQTLIELGLRREDGNL